MRSIHRINGNDDRRLGCSIPALGDAIRLRPQRPQLRAKPRIGPGAVQTPGDSSQRLSRLGWRGLWVWLCHYVIAQRCQ
jgi:hypothetical protein